MKVLKTFSYMKSGCDLGLMCEIMLALKKLKNYFYCFNPSCCDEAMARAYSHACKNYNAEYEEIKPYLKSLARTIMRKGKENSVIASEDIEDIAVDTNTCVEKKALDSVSLSDMNRYVAKEVMLPFIEQFLKLGSLLQSEGADALAKTTSFSESFQVVCRNVIRKRSSEEFIRSVIFLYDKYETILSWFVEQDRFINKNYIEANYSIINNKFYQRLEKPQKNKLESKENCKSDKPKTREEEILGYTSRKTIIVDENGKEISKPDRYNNKMYLKGSGSIYRVKYSDLLYDMLTLASSHISNELTLVLEGKRLIRTPAGSVCMVGIDDDSIFDLFFEELITNILSISKSRLIAIGYDYIYLVRGKYGKFDYIDMEGMIGFFNIKLPIEEIDLPQYQKKGV